MATLVKKIDIHVHTAPRKGLPRYCGSDGSDYCTPTELRSKYDAMGIEKGVILPSLNPECNFRIITNEMAAQMAEDYPETFYWFCNIDPRYGTNSDEMDFTPFINHYKAMGAKGVGEICANLYFDDPRVLNLFKHCEVCGMPVIFQCTVKPTPSILQPQQSISLSKGEITTLEIKGRHDPCIVPRAVPVVEAAAAIAIYDLILGNTQTNRRK